MAKRDSVSNDIREWLEENADEEEATDLAEVWLVNLYPARMKVAGPVTGKEYFFNGAGAKVKVAKVDADVLLLKLRGGCCGGPRSPIFELVGD